MPRKGNQHRVLDVVVQRVTVGDALESKLGGERDQFGQARVRRPTPPVHLFGEEVSQRFRG